MAVRFLRQVLIDTPFAPTNLNILLSRLPLWSDLSASSLPGIIRICHAEGKSNLLEHGL